MITGLLDLSLERRFAVLLTTFALIAAGIYCYLVMPVDAFPDVTNVQVQVLSDAPGLGPLEVEKLITAPIERVMNGLPKVEIIRSRSQFGVSTVVIVFEDGVDVYFARTLVLERLAMARSLLPEGIEPEMGPVSTGLGQIFAFKVESDVRSPTELRTLQDWVIKPFLRTVPGVTDVLSQGGFERQIHVEVDPQKLLAYELTLRDVYDAVARNNANVGGKYIDRGSEQLVVRSVGMFRDKQDISDIVLSSSKDGTPIFLGHVARVIEAHEVRQGTNDTTTTYDELGEKSKETVTGIVLMLAGENSKRVIERVKDKLEDLENILPADVKVIAYYDQADLVSKAIETVQSALQSAAVIVALVLFLFLWNLRSALVVVSSIPLSILICFVLMNQAGLSANLMSFGGLAIAIGMMVDPAISMVENIFRHFQQAEDGADPIALARSAAHEVANPIFFAIVIIIVVFLPLVTLQGMEGKMFSPLAYVITFAMVGALALTLTVVPVLAVMTIPVGRPPGSDPDESSEPFFVAWLKSLYRPLLGFCWRFKKSVIVVAVASLVGSLGLMGRIGGEFMPVLDEGSMLVRVTLLPNVNLTEAVRIAQLVEQSLNDFPEINQLVSKIGRGSLGGDPDPLNSIEVYCGLKSRDEWRFPTKEALVGAVRSKIKDIPGAWISISQPIANRVDELVSGVKAAVAIKIYGDNLQVLGALAENIRAEVSKVDGVADLVAERMTGLKQLEVVVDRSQIARFGLNVDNVQDMIETAVGGKIATYFIEGERRFGVAVRFTPEYRSDVETIRNLLVRTPTGQRVPLENLARIDITDAPPLILREQGSRLITVMCNVQDRDLVSFIEECKQKIDRNVEKPVGYRIVYGGQFENQQRAAERLGVVVPLCIGAIFLLLYIAFGSFRYALVVLTNIPFSVIGGILAVYLFDFNLSVPSMVGFIALFGIAIQNGVVMLECFVDLRRQGLGVEETIFEGAAIRMRPVLMTAVSTGLGLVPILASNGIGSEVQKPLAAVVAGGLFSSTALTLCVLPLLFGMVEGTFEAPGDPGGGDGEPSAAPSEVPRETPAVTEEHPGEDHLGEGGPSEAATGEGEARSGSEVSGQPEPDGDEGQQQEEIGDGEGQRKDLEEKS